MNDPTNRALARPSVSTTQPLSKVSNVGEALEHPEFRLRIASALPRHMQPDRMLRVYNLAVQKSPDLAKAPMRELIGALIGFAAIGIEPNTPLQHGWLIPYAKRAKNDRGQWETVGVQIQPIIGYRGYIDLARRSGTLVSVHGDVVMAGDEFDYEYGTSAHLRHRYGPRGDVESPVCAYAVAQLEGGHDFQVLPWSHVLRVRDGSDGYVSAKRQGGRKLETTPWVAHMEAMASKTAIRRLAKTLPMSIEMATAHHIDELGEGRGARFSAVLDSDPKDVNADVVAGLVEEDERADLTDTAETVVENEPTPEPTPAPTSKPKATRSPKPTPAPEPTPEPTLEAEEEAAGGLVAIDQFGEVEGEGLSTSDAMDTIKRIVASCTTQDALKAVWEHNDAIVSALGKGVVGPVFAARRDELEEVAAQGDDQVAQGEPTPAPSDAEESGFGIDLDRCKDETGAPASMAVAAALDAVIKERVHTPDDWARFEFDNADALAVLEKRARSLHKRMADRIAKGKAG